MIASPNPHRQQILRTPVDSSTQRKSRFCRTHCKWACASWFADPNARIENSSVLLVETMRICQWYKSAQRDSRNRQLCQPWWTRPREIWKGTPILLSSQLMEVHFGKRRLYRLTDMSLLTPTRSYSRPKHCVAAICSAKSSMAQVKMCWKIALKEI